MPLSHANHSSFVWKDFSRFVEVSPVEQGWLVLWGRFHDRGHTRELVGNRTYVDLAGVRRRIGDSVSELTRDPGLVSEALVLFDRFNFPEHTFEPIPDLL
jgi:hypothetical protein